MLLVAIVISERSRIKRISTVFLWDQLRGWVAPRALAGGGAAKADEGGESHAKTQRREGGDGGVGARI